MQHQPGDIPRQERFQTTPRAMAKATPTPELSFVAHLREQLDTHSQSANANMDCYSPFGPRIGFAPHGRSVTMGRCDASPTVPLGQDPETP